MRENIEDFKKRMWRTYLISIKEECEYKGFIKSKVRYEAKIPEVKSGTINAGRGADYTYIIGYGAQDIWLKVRRWLRENPEKEKILRNWRVVL